LAAQALLFKYLMRRTVSVQLDFNEVLRRVSVWSVGDRAGEPALRILFKFATNNEMRAGTRVANFVVSVAFGQIINIADANRRHLNSEHLSNKGVSWVALNKPRSLVMLA
jgi:hypothetical protein